jgi:hypothetical protein
MKKLFLILPLATSLAACSSLNPFDSRDPYQKRADFEMERQEKAMNKVLDEDPKFCKSDKAMISNSVVYACGESNSMDKGMAEHKALTIAYGKICTTAGGEVDSQTKIFNADTGGSSNEASERAIRSLCRKVDVTGVETAQQKTIVANGKFYSWAQVALPMGDANILRKNKINEELSRTTVGRSDKAFQELDQQTYKPVQ